MADIDALVLGSLDPSASQQHNGGGGSQLPGAGSEDVSSDMARLKRVRLIEEEKLMKVETPTFDVRSRTFDLLHLSPSPPSPNYRRHRHRHPHHHQKKTPTGFRQRATLPRGPPLRARTRLPRARSPNEARGRGPRPRAPARRRGQALDRRLRGRGVKVQIPPGRLPPREAAQGRGVRRGAAGHARGARGREGRGICGAAVARRGGARSRLLLGRRPAPQAGGRSEAAAAVRLACPAVGGLFGAGHGQRAQPGRARRRAGPGGQG